MKKKILIIKEHNSFDNVIKNHFNKNKYEIEISSNYSDGFNKAMSLRPDLIIFDSKTINEDYTITKKLKSNDLLKSIPIITMNSLMKNSSSLKYQPKSNLCS